MQQRQTNKSLQQRETEGRGLHESGRSEGRVAYQELGGAEADPTIGLGTATALPTSGGYTPRPHTSQRSQLRARRAAALELGDFRRHRSLGQKGWRMDSWACHLQIGPSSAKKAQSKASTQIPIRCDYGWANYPKSKVRTRKTRARTRKIRTRKTRTPIRVLTHGTRNYYG